MARTKTPTTHADPSVVAAWIDELNALADQVSTLAERANAELGEDAERLGRLDPLSLTYAFSRGCRQWAESLQQHFLEY